LLLRLRTALLPSFTTRREFCLARRIVPVFKRANHSIVARVKAQKCGLNHVDARRIKMHGVPKHYRAKHAVESFDGKNARLICN
jgi:hypothetical protein